MSVIKIMNKINYKDLRAEYIPNEIKAIFLLESPPQDETYFYDKLNGASKSLFLAMMKIIRYSSKNKVDGLNKFKRSGFLIVDVCYEPVNGLKSKKRREKLLSCQESLIQDLQGLPYPKVIPLILVKANVCRLFEPILLKEKQFKVLNDGQIIPFPSNGWQKVFHDRACSLLRLYDLLN